ncbi:hypothetical protein ACRALDRAFT_2017722 [Sodiomyces alcalophilus JCM 7366]|uniref:uncharacterized protein n=1 Tax=Sodiomyces alcalophilus JCM 7366 TaxID=591952 RepID=UPI0039B37675
MAVIETIALVSSWILKIMFYGYCFPGTSFCHGNGHHQPIVVLAREVACRLDGHPGRRVEIGDWPVGAKRATNANGDTAQHRRVLCAFPSQALGAKSRLRSRFPAASPPQINGRVYVSTTERRLGLALVAVSEQSDTAAHRRGCAMYAAPLRRQLKMTGDEKDAGNFACLCWVPEPGRSDNDGRVRTLEAPISSNMVGLTSHNDASGWEVQELHRDFNICALRSMPLGPAPGTVIVWAIFRASHVVSVSAARELADGAYDGSLDGATTVTQRFGFLRCSSASDNVGRVRIWTSAYNVTVNGLILSQANFSTVHGGDPSSVDLDFLAHRVELYLSASHHDGRGRGRGRVTENALEDAHRIVCSFHKPPAGNMQTWPSSEHGDLVVGLQPDTLYFTHLSQFNTLGTYLPTLFTPTQVSNHHRHVPSPPDHIHRPRPLQKACKDQAGKDPYSFTLSLSKTGAFQIFEYSWLLRLMAAEPDETLTSMSMIHPPLCSPGGMPLAMPPMLQIGKNNNPSSKGPTPAASRHVPSMGLPRPRPRPRHVRIHVCRMRPQLFRYLAFEPLSAISSPMDQHPLDPSSHRG